MPHIFGNHLCTTEKVFIIIMSCSVRYFWLFALSFFSPLLFIKFLSFCCPIVYETYSFLSLIHSIRQHDLVFRVFVLKKNEKLNASQSSAYAKKLRRSFFRQVISTFLPSWKRYQRSPVLSLQMTFGVTCLFTPRVYPIFLCYCRRSSYQNYIQRCVRHDAR